MSNCGAIIVSKQTEGKVAANWIRNALDQQRDFDDVEVEFGGNRNGNYVIKIDFGLLGLDQSMRAAQNKLEELVRKKVVQDANVVGYGMVDNIQVRKITINTVNSRSRSMSR